VEFGGWGCKFVPSSKGEALIAVVRVRAVHCAKMEYVQPESLGVLVVCGVTELGPAIVK
jgi:hypothetical protein